VKDVGFIVKYSSEQRLVSFGENVSEIFNGHVRYVYFAKHNKTFK